MIINIEKSSLYYNKKEGKYMSDFVILKHNALRAGPHYDLRFQIGSDKFDSFAVPKGIPLVPGKKVAAIKTTIHSREEAFFTGTIKPGNYGAGTLKMWDKGKCNIKKFSKHHIEIEFFGKKVKGIYHLLALSNQKGKVYLLFKSKRMKE